MERRIRLVAIDLDGTLLDDAKRVSEQTVEALSCLGRNGVRVVIASARPPRSVRHIYRQLQLDTWQINYNGAMVWDEGERRVVEHWPMDGALVREIIEAARDLYEELLVSCEIADRWYTDRFEQTYTTETGKLFPPDVVQDVCQICSQPITKLMLLGEPRTIARTEHYLAERYAGRVNLVRSDDDLIQIMHPGVGKGLTLERVARHYGIAMEEVLAIGDAPNDVGMLQLAGVAVAMDNAHPLVKEVADWVAPSNNDHGVCAALKRYGLC